jgi:predicted metal-dependent phosphoesterase TrpH
VEIVKCDMHVHSYYSGPCTTALVSSFCRESYSNPEEVYDRLRRRQMNLFTLTDHDAIDGSERLRRYPDFFLSEELTCQMPSGTQVHIGVYDIHERQHVQLQQRRNDLVSLLMYLSERRIFFSVNHVFSSVTGRRELEDFIWFQEYFPAVETRNSHMLESANRHAATLARRWEKVGIAGSDAHALPSVGTAYTEVPGARDKEEFFAGLKAGKGRVAGESGSFSKLTRDVFLIAWEMMHEKSWTALFAPLAVLVPVVTYWNYHDERAFSRHWAAEVLGEPQPGRRFGWVSVPQPAAEELV